MNPNLNAFLTSVRALLLVVGGLLAEHGLEHSTYYSWVMIGAGSVLVIGPAIWGVWSSLVNWRKAAAIGVQAGINLTVSGRAVTDDGKVISQFSSHTDATPPKLVTRSSAQEIIDTFGPRTLAK
jgi:hypothetical protein